MKSNLLFIVILLLPVFSFSQIKYEPGYYINQDGEKISCWIKNKGWKNNPTSFQYKQTETGSEQTATIEDVNEFGFEGTLKYKKVILDMDKSSEVTGQLDEGSLPVFIKDTVYLKVLVEGKATLLKYEDGHIKKFFLAINDEPIEQLMYKIYLTPSGKIAENLGYKRQLNQKLSCAEITKNDRIKLKYKEGGLTKFFEKYNRCQNVDFITYKHKVKRDLFNLYFRPGVTLVSLSIKNPFSPSRTTDFGNTIGGRLGLEFEFILPYAQNKFAFFCEPTFNKFSMKKEKEGTLPSSTDYQLVTLDFNSIQMPIGLRYYIFLNDNSQIFLDGSYTMVRDLGSTYEFEKGADVEAVSNGSFNLGVGYRFRKKLVVQFRQSFTGSLVLNTAPWSSKYRVGTFVIGYDISGSKPTKK